MIPAGTKVYIPGYGPGVVEDTGGKIRGYKLDVYLPNREECIDFGRRTVEVRVME